MSLDMIIKFNIEQDTKKLFKNIIRINNEDQKRNADRKPGLLRAVFYDTPKINYNSYTFSLRQASIHDMGMPQLKGKRTGVQPYYHERNIKIRQNGFSGLLNFDNAGTQFEWIIASIILILSKEHRNTYSVYNSEKACHIIQKVTISNIKDSQGGYISKVYDLNDFDDQHILYRQYCAYISNKPSTLAMLDFSNNHEIKDTVEKRYVFMENTSKIIFIDMRDSLGITGKKDPLKHNDESILVEISLKEAAAFDLDVTVTGQSFGEFVYESGTERNMVSMYEYKLVKDTKAKKLDELSYKHRQSRKRKLGIDKYLIRVV